MNALCARGLRVVRASWRRWVVGKRWAFVKDDMFQEVPIIVRNEIWSWISG